jgi:hypothetical protein
MRDYIAWYLIELRRRLRNVEPQQKVEDFLLETRTHLQESIEEMGARGITEDAATKSAIADFGHPSLVAQAFRGRRSFPTWAYWAVVLTVVALLSPMAYALVISAGDVQIGRGNRGSFEFLWYTAAGLLAIFITTVLWRRWSAVPITLGLAFIALVSGLDVMRRVEPYQSPESDYFLLLDRYNAGKQQRLRGEWLKAYDETIVPLRLAFEAHSASPTAGLAQAMVLKDGRLLYPDKTFGGQPRAYSVLPFDLRWGLSAEWVHMERESTQFLLATTSSHQAATDAWIQYGEEYFAYADDVKSGVARERAAFTNPADVTSREVLQRLVVLPLMFLGYCGLFGLLANALVIGGTAGWSAMRRWEWRRELN